jgi:hypothetical protein
MVSGVGDEPPPPQEIKRIRMMESTCAEIGMAFKSEFINLWARIPPPSGGGGIAPPFLDFY